MLLKLHWEIFGSRLNKYLPKTTQRCWIPTRCKCSHLHCFLESPFLPQCYFFTIWSVRGLSCADAICYMMSVQPVKIREVVVVVQVTEVRWKCLHNCRMQADVTWQLSKDAYIRSSWVIEGCNRPYKSATNSSLKCDAAAESLFNGLQNQEELNTEMHQLSQMKSE